MNTKLTLSLDKEVILKAKAYAKSQGRSLSEVIENYLKLISKKEKIDSISPTVKKLAGSFKVGDDFDYKQELKNALIEKYLDQ